MIEYDWFYKKKTIETILFKKFKQNKQKIFILQMGFFCGAGLNLNVHNVMGKNDFDHMVGLMVVDIRLQILLRVCVGFLFLLIF